MKKYAHAKRHFITSLIMTAMLLTGTSAAYAAEVPAGVTEVKIPLALESASVIAGAEIAFNQSSGLEYVRFEPTSGAENPLKTTANGATWIGFFSATNRYRPSGGSLTFGNLVFRYDGDESEQVTISETRLHSLTGEGSDVKSVRSKPNTVIPVTRKATDVVERNNDPILVSTQPRGEDNDGVNGAGDMAGASGPSDTNGSNDINNTGGADNTSGAKDKSSDKNSTKNTSNDKNSTSGAKNKSGGKSSTNATGGTKNTSGSNSATGNSGYANAATSSTQTAIGSVNAGDTADETIVGSGETGASSMVPFSAPETISDGDIPLTDVIGQPVATQGGFSIWWLAAALIAGVLAGVLVMFIALKRRRKNDGKSEETGEIYISSR
jgi:hypothetical protein